MRGPIEIVQRKNPDENAGFETNYEDDSQRADPVGAEGAQAMCLRSCATEAWIYYPSPTACTPAQLAIQR